MLRSDNASVADSGQEKWWCINNLPIIPVKSCNICLDLLVAFQYFLHRHNFSLLLFLFGGISFDWWLMSPNPSQDEWPSIYYRCLAERFIKTLRDGKGDGRDFCSERGWGRCSIIVCGRVVVINANTMQRTCQRHLHPHPLPQSPPNPHAHHPPTWLHRWRRMIDQVRACQGHWKGGYTERNMGILKWIAK